MSASETLKGDRLTCRDPTLPKLPAWAKGKREKTAGLGRRGYSPFVCCTLRTRRGRSTTDTFGPDDSIVLAFAILPPPSPEVAICLSQSPTTAQLMLICVTYDWYYIDMVRSIIWQNKSELISE